MRRYSLATQFSSQVGQLAKLLSAISQAASDSLFPLLILLPPVPLCREGSIYHTHGFAVKVNVLRSVMSPNIRGTKEVTKPRE